MALTLGAPAPLFSAPSPVNPRFAFGSLGGRYIVLAFLPGPGPERDAALALVRSRSAAFDDDRLVFFGVLPDAESYAAARNEPPVRWFSDVDGELRRLYGAVDEAGGVKPLWVAIDPSLRVLAWVQPEQGGELIGHLASRGDPDRHAGTPLHAPVLIVPRIFEPSFCQRLIDYYAAAGGLPSGTMVDRDGRTIGVLSDFKSRRDASITDERLIAACRARISHRLLPEIRRAFQFRTTHIERYIVGCYDAEEGGWFNPHRDDTTLGTAHRKFAVSINLNAEDFEGGDLRFPEFGRRTYRPPTGGAVVFSCSLLHEATRVTRGTRYAFLPFLYDAEGAEVRAANLHALDPSRVETEQTA
ncbi:MAG: 2OG-Fe(II) oxygenase [Phenylobacterium sp.]|uniref:2OG-Fe(II) oxygenase n=1 Tax=Phenylobacterium sp. TaxID=1871053 RepID=UPI001A4F315F|nr:2OG-Fe(II) oxygenase [Phenylobacterium sp.]MBL8772377.1 2OG-Fe(II) oxygenase [Phenylobacterium sp.]